MADLVAGARVTSEQVIEVISTTLSNEQVNAFINMSHTLVDARLANCGLSDALLMQIELLLAAHFVALRDPRPQQEKFDEYSVTYQGTSGQGLSATQYGQQALALDVSGRLAGLAQPKAVLRLS